MNRSRFPKKRLDLMPSKSGKQARTMAWAAHDPKFAKRKGIPRKVAREFNRADSKSGMLSDSMIKNTASMAVSHKMR